MTKVLVADDSETILLLLRTRLEMEGYEVITASDGQQVLDALSGDGTEKPDLILLDAMMPGKSGIDVLHELREAGVETPILIVSAHREEEGLGDAAAGRGAAGFVSKPIDFDDLLGRIAELTT